MPHQRNVDAARCHIGGHQHIHLACAEIGQRALALVLAAVAMDGHSVEAPARQEFRDLVGAMFGAREHDGGLARVLLQIALQQAALVALRNEMHALGDLVGWLAGGRDLHADRIAQIGRGDFLDILGHGGAEQQRLALVRQVARDGAQRMDEAHVQHMVGLVQHQISAALKADIAALQQVDEAARRGDQHIGALGQTVGLAVDRGAAHNHGDLHWRATGEGIEVLVNLLHQLARGGEDQRAHIARPGRVGDIQNTGEQRQAERGGLAGAGLRKAHQITAAHHMWDGFGLNGGGRGEASGRKCRQKLRRKAEIGKRNSHVIILHGQGPFRRHPAPQGRTRLATGVIPRYRRPAAPLREGGNQCPCCKMAHAAERRTCRRWALCCQMSSVLWCAGGRQPACGTGAGRSVSRRLAL